MASSLGSRVQSWNKVAPCSFSLHLARNGGVGPVIWSLPTAKLVLGSISVLNTSVLIFPLLCLPTGREKNNQTSCLGGATSLWLQCPRAFWANQLETFSWQRGGVGCNFSVLPSQVPVLPSHSRRERNSPVQFPELRREDMRVGGAAVSFCGEEFPAYSWKVWDEKESTFASAASVTLPCVPRSWGCARMGGWCYLEIPVGMDGEEVGASGAPSERESASKQVEMHPLACIPNAPPVN